MSSHGKRYSEDLQKVDRDREYEPAEAVALVRSLANAKFDESIEVHVRTGLNVRHADEQLRGTIALPNGVGKDVKIVVFAQGPKVAEAEAAGADEVGGEDLAKRIEEGFDEFDVAIATPDMDALCRSVASAACSVRRARCQTRRSGRSRWTWPRRSRTGSRARSSTAPTAQTAIVHLVIGKASFGETQLLENYAAVIEELVRAKPAVAKGRYLRSITLTSTMGPGVSCRPPAGRAKSPARPPRSPRSGYTAPSKTHRPRPSATFRSFDRRRKTGAGWSEQRRF